ncbi:MAG: fatty acid cis/trans isomerase [Gammaproteobacteria bacterium]|nr:fatty acid cis/trans isomerase [Gammaproteobacteria bacterium]
MKHNYLLFPVTILFTSLLIVACSSKEASLTADQAVIEYDLLYTLPKQPVDYDAEVRPVLENRCVVCHGCYDAPCQLKLSSPEGIHRGASKVKVYNAARITADEPTRLFIDAMTTEEWRQKGFAPVLNEGEAGPRANLEDSVMYRMLRQKQLYPQARTGMLSDDFDLGLDRVQSCPKLDEFDKYAAEHPKGGMPYAMPNLSHKDYSTLVHWLAQGAPMPQDSQPSKVAASQIKQWEAFLNGDDNRHKLVSRYLYEHLFQAHLHFAGTDDREFYRLVRSATPPGEDVVIIPTRRPYGEPPGPTVYYRIVRHQGSIVAKTHMVYELSDKRMQRYRELFFKPDYDVAELPSYEATVASNPIKTFAAIPVKSRYRFLLDEARFFVEGFIKGPVCRGQIALNVIEDQFWVVFFDPDAKIMSLNDKFLNDVADYLASPAELEDNFKLIGGKSYYEKLFQKYARTKDSLSADFKPVKLDEAMDYIWDGDGKNPNAALTIFRHTDSASVNFGFIGDYPETAWVIDFSVLERIHYLLVAGYDVYGNLGHQLNTRLYMDFLRTEGEDYFLVFLPADRRQAIRNSWYQGIRQSDKDAEGTTSWLNREYVVGYKTDDVQRELFQQIEHRLDKLAGGGDYINRCLDDSCIPKLGQNVQRITKAMRKAAKMDGGIVQFLPDLAFIRVRMGGRPEDDLAYTMISNKAYKSVSSMFEGEQIGERRDYAYDTQTIVSWLEGAYPNFFYVVELDDIEAFVEQYNNIKNRDDYEAFVYRFGLRRTNEDFWLNADWFNSKYRQEQPRLSGIYDLNRYQNR